MHLSQSIEPIILYKLKMCRSLIFNLQIILIAIETLIANEIVNIDLKIKIQNGFNNIMLKDSVNGAIVDFKKEVKDTEISFKEIEDIENVCEISNFKGNENSLIIDFTYLNASKTNETAVIMSTPFCNYEPNQKECLKIKSPGEMMIPVIRSFVESLQLGSVAILFDQTFDEISTKYAVLLTNLEVRQIIVPIHASNIEKQLAQLKTVDLANYFIAANSTNIIKIIRSAKKKDMFSRNIAWYLLTKDIRTHDIEHEVPIAIIIKPIFNLITYPKSHNFTNIDELYTYNIIKIGLQQIYHTKQVEPNNCTDILKNNTIFSSISLNRIINDSNIYQDNMNIEYNDIQLSITLINNIAKNKMNNVIGIWQPSQIASLSFNKSLSNFLPTKQYKIVTLQQPPFVYRRVNSEGKIYYEGYCVDLINELQRIAHFSYEIFDLSDINSTKIPLPENLLNELKEKRADIVLAALYSGMEDDQIEFTIPFYDLIGIKMLMKKSVAESSLFRFLTVMEPDVWFSILGAYAATSILLWLIDRFSPFSYQNNQQKLINDQEKRIFSLKESLWFCVTSLTPQGSGDAPKSVSGRLIAATWWLFGFVFIASYTANLAAFLTVARLENAINSIDSLANQYQVKYSAVDNSSTMKYFEKMSNIEEDFFEKWKEMTVSNSNPNDKEKYSVWNYPVGDKYSKMWKLMKDTSFLNSIEKGIQKIKNTKQGFILLADSIEVDYAVMNDCDLTTAGEEFSRRPIGLAVSRGSVLKEQLSMGILKLQNSRTLEILKEKWWSNNPYKVQCPEDDKNSDGISLKNIGGIFFVIFAGIVLSWIILGLEYLWYDCITIRLFKNSVASRDSVQSISYSNNNSIIFEKSRAVNSQQTDYKDKTYFYTIKSNNYLHKYN